MQRIIDLAHPIAVDQPAYPGDPPTRIARVQSASRDGWNLNRLELSAHTGTHLDAPRHFFDDGAALDQLPLDQFCGPAVCIDLAPGSALEPGTSIDVSVLTPHAAQFLAGARVLFRTGWDRRYGQPGYYENWPSLAEAAARWIAARGIGLLGLDTPGVDRAEPICHRILLSPPGGLVLLENLAGLERLPPRFTLVALPLKIVGGEASPVRAAALVD